MTGRVCIIGAGPSGLAQLRAFQSAAGKGADLPDIVCYEKQSDWGGLWNYTWRTGADEHGSPCHGSMYHYPSFDTEAVNRIFYEWKKHKKQAIMQFRDNGHVSPKTGTGAPAHHTPWTEALDDSFENYLQTQ